MPATPPPPHRWADRGILGAGLTAVVLAGALIALFVSATSAPFKTAGRSAPDIPVENVRAHLAAFEEIAGDHGGNRAHGEPGYRASLRYIKKKLDTAGYHTTVQEFDNDGTPGYNLIADWPSESGEEVVVVGAHLDSTDEGPGINDNATGAAAILETALAVSRQKLDADTTIRFAWWDAEEEDDMVGSAVYVDELPKNELDLIKAYLNFDMIASPNPGYFVHEEHNELEKLLVDFYTERGVETESFTGEGDSDYANFARVGVPFGGVLTGADTPMSKEQAAMWDGQADEPFDDCYHTECDTVENVNESALDLNSDAIAHAVWALAAG